MVKRLNGQLIFCYNCSNKQNNKLLSKNKLLASLLVILMGIFLLPKPAFLSGISTEKLIELTNLERIRAGLEPLTVNQLLTKAAIDKGQAIINSQTFKHNIGDKKFSAWVQDVGYNYSYIGENLAIDFATSEGIMNAWQNSYLHNKNLLNPYYQEIGVAATVGDFNGQETTVVVQIFGAPAKTTISPKISGAYLSSSNATFNQSSLAKQVNSGRQIEAENLITHALSNQILPQPYINDKLLVATNNYTGNRLNKLFERFDYSSWYWQVLTLFLSFAAIGLILYLYYFYFFKIFKPRLL